MTNPNARTPDDSDWNSSGANGRTACECDNTHKQNDTVCQYCWNRGRRHWNDNGYIAFYNGRQTEVWATSLYAAKEQAVTFFKAPKSKRHMVSVVLAEKDGQAVTHVADF